MQFEEMITIYTIVHATPQQMVGRGSYQTLAAARKELEKQISAEKELIPADYDCEEKGEDFWEMYQDGYAAAAYSRLEIVPAMLHYGECE